MNTESFTPVPGETHGFGTDNKTPRYVRNNRIVQGGRALEMRARIQKNPQSPAPGCSWYALITRASHPVTLEYFSSHHEALRWVHRFITTYETFGLFNCEVDANSGLPDDIEDARQEIKRLKADLTDLKERSMILEGELHLTIVTRDTWEHEAKRNEEEKLRLKDQLDNVETELTRLRNMTARDHLDAAWEAAYQVPEGQMIPAGVPYIERFNEGDYETFLHGSPHTVSSRFLDSVGRTLDPFPHIASELESERYVWATTDTDVRTIYMQVLPDRWDGAIGRTLTTEEIATRNPVPVKEEAAHADGEREVAHWKEMYENILSSVTRQENFTVTRTDGTIEKYHYVKAS